MWDAYRVQTYATPTQENIKRAKHTNSSKQNTQMQSLQI